MTAPALTDEELAALALRGFEAVTYGDDPRVVAVRDVKAWDTWTVSRTAAGYTLSRGDDENPEEEPIVDDCATWADLLAAVAEAEAEA